MKFSWLVCVLAFLVSLPPRAVAQIVELGPRDPILSQTWFENEGMWRGVWVPARPGVRDGVYSSQWTLIGHSDTERAILRITIEGDRVTVARTGRNATCTYQGQLSADRASVVGTYTCNTAPSPMRWSARFGAQTAAPDVATSVDEASNYLRYTWLEREGDWRGTWVPHNVGAGDGLYEGRWIQPPHTGSVVAQLSISLRGGVFTVRRTQREGACTYRGTLGPDNVTVTGTYTCDWHPSELHWSATIQLPRR
jgi:hypothetical protein